MTIWPVQDAKARFSEMLDNCLTDGPQVISRRGVDAAVLVPIDQWRRLKGNTPTLKELLLSGHARADIPVPSRKGHRWRQTAVFD
ncbi:MAG: type II toxin-antitoxin system Phd/YefM family antitoxin [Acetobacteraceae bacterium]|nr:type II toxin-antitoxin system Phd/YefM family antitoxin [Acetobacteraceae bacterium]